MNVRTKKTAALPIVCALLCMLGLGSCASSSALDSSAAFEGGDKRTPTAKTLYALARILYDQGQSDQGKFVLARAIQQHPEFLPAYVELAERLLDERRAHEAIQLLSVALSYAPRDPVILNDRGLCHLFQRDYARAIEDFGAAAAAAGAEGGKARANLALTLGLMGSYDEALGLYRQVLPEDAARHNLAVVCEARNDVARADTEYALAAELGREREREREVKARGAKRPR